MVDVLDRLSLLTTIDKKSLAKLSDKACLCICDEIHKAELENNLRCYFDLDIGTLGIDFSSGDSVKYKFTPSKGFEKMIVNTIVNKESPLVEKVEQSLVKKITNTYKDLF